MAITGIDTIEGKQIIAAGAVSAKSAEMAYKDENGNPITGYQVAGDYYSASNPSGFITGVDLTPYQLTADMTAYQPAGDYLTTGDSANFYTTANESGFISEVPDTYLQNTDLSTEDGKVTAISGIPLSAGGDVPEGVMVESGLEYNAVNEISAYNGSAIAQYGAEKQFIVHDDTLVHLSNSAQYALGCNISALQRLMGIDETVLWINPNPQMITTGTSLTAELSEPISAFKQIRFDVKASYDYNESIVAARKYVDFIVNDTAKNEISLWLANPRGTTVYIDACLMYLQNNMFTAFSGIRIQRNYPSLTGGSDNTSRGPYIYGIYGIGRKS